MRVRACASKYIVPFADPVAFAPRNMPATIDSMAFGTPFYENMPRAHAREYQSPTPGYDPPNLTRHAENRLTVKVNCAVSTRGGATSALEAMCQKEIKIERCGSLCEGELRSSWNCAFDRDLKMTVGSET